MNYSITTALATLLILAITPQIADAQNDFYVGASIGSAQLDDDFDGFDVDADSTAFRLIAGWQINDYVSVEAGYHRFGAFEQQFIINSAPVNVSLKADGFTLGGTVTVPVGEKFSLFGRVGSFFWDGDADINNVSQARPEDTNLYLGLGFKYALSDRFSVLADYSNYDLEDTESKVASLGISYSF